MKILKKIIVIGMVFLMCFTLFCGCKNNKVKGSFYNLNEVYENNEISKQDLLSMIYYVYGYITEENRDEYPEDFVPTPKEPEKLDDSIKQVIENAYKYKLKKENEKLYSDAKIEAKYCGTYNDYICVGMKIETPGVGHGEVNWKETIDGVSYWRKPCFTVLLYKIET